MRSTGIAQSITLRVLRVSTKVYKMFAKKLSVFCRIIVAFDVFIVVIGLRTSSGGLVNENHVERKQ